MSEVNKTNNIKFYICPNCRTHYDPDSNTGICEKCNEKLMTNDEFLNYRVNLLHAKKEQDEKFNKKFNFILTGFAVICLLAIVIFVVQIVNAPSPNHEYICARCHREFSDYSNQMSIAKSNYCLKCKEDVDTLLKMNDALENMD